MDARVLAEQLLEAELELRRAQMEHDGSERARRRYSDAVARAVIAEIRAQIVLRSSDTCITFV